MEKQSPFTPGRPVPPEFFVGRRRELEEIVEQRLSQVAGGRSEYVFVQGEKGVGKSSFVDLVRLIAVREYNFLTIHCYLGNAAEPQDIPEIVMRQFLTEAPERGIFEKLRGTFQRYIKETSVGLFGVNITVELRPEEKQFFYQGFSDLLRGIYERVKDTRSGLLVVLDDINGVAGHPQFAPRIKSMVDGMASQAGEFPLFLILVGTPERRAEMMGVHPSVARIFWVVDLKPVAPDETREFFLKTFGSVEKKLEHSALDWITSVSGGYPVLMHEIGDGVFWADNDGIIDDLDVLNGIIKAAESVGTKYMDVQIYRAIRSERYLKILRSMGKLGFVLGRTFERSELLKVIPASEHKNLNNFLTRMVELGLLIRTRRGRYEFANELYQLYVAMEATGAKARK